MTHISYAYYNMKSVHGPLFVAKKQGIMYNVPLSYRLIYRGLAQLASALRSLDREVGGENSLWLFARKPSDANWLAIVKLRGRGT